jgi:hypothetical protein
MQWLTEHDMQMVHVLFTSYGQDRTFFEEYSSVILVLCCVVCLLCFAACTGNPERAGVTFSGCAADGSAPCTMVR